MVAAKNANPPSPELTTVANTPQSYWLDQAFPSATVADTVRKYAGAAQAAGAMPVLTLYGIPHRDCGSFASGGFATAADYRRWIDGVASGLGSAPAAIILEPDALAMADCLSPDQRQERFDLLRYAVDTLTGNTSAAMYVDAGHSRWLSAEEMAARLNEVGVDRARGFSLNTSNFYTTDEEIGYGESRSTLTRRSDRSWASTSVSSWMPTPFCRLMPSSVHNSPGHRKTSALFGSSLPRGRDATSTSSSPSSV